MSSGIQAVWPPRVAVLFQFGRCASEGSESTLREADVLATLPMYDPGMLASWYRRRYGSVRLQVGRRFIYKILTRYGPERSRETRGSPERF